MKITLDLIIKAFCLTALVTAALTPLSIKVAHRIGAIDVPRDSRRMHTDAVPRFGGLAIYIGSMVGLWVFAGDFRQIRIAMLGGTLMYLLGAADDLRNLHAGVKFSGQVVIAIIMYALGIRITFITNYFGSGLVMFGDVLCFIVTVLWIVGITNAINLTDGLDGLAAGISGIISLSIAYIAYIHGDIYGSAMVCISLVCLAGSCAGFLPFNFSPAKTFMGDSGALYLGFMIAIFSVISPLKRSTIIATIVPVFALAIPIFDTFAAIVRRWLSGKPIMEADKQHLHHKLIAAGHDHKRSVMMLYGITGIMGMAAVQISRELYKDAFVLILIVMTYLYVFATDPAHQSSARDGKCDRDKAKEREKRRARKARERMERKERIAEEERRAKLQEAERNNKKEE